MEDKTFELLEKLYVEFTEFRQETKEHLTKHDEEFEGIKQTINRIDNDVTGLKADVTDLKADVTDLKADVTGLKKDVLRIENEHGRKLDALFDGYKLTYEKVSAIEHKFDILT